MSEPSAPTKSNQSARERIFARPRPKGEQLEIKDWDVTIELRSMSIAQKSQLLSEEGEDSAPKILTLLPEVIIYTCYDVDTGEPVFTADDLPWLQDAPSSIIERVATEGLRVSGMDEAAGERGKGAS